MSDLPGVLPIIESQVLETALKDSPSWFAMPLAQPAPELVSSLSSVEEAVTFILGITECLAELHSRGVSHRDIKVENLFLLEDQPHLSDFGLADAAWVAEITEAGKPVGSRFYIAPEMITDPAGANGQLVDVYSIGKTLWVILSHQNHPLPGQHRIDDEAMRISTYIDHPRARQLDLLLERMTSTAPHDRPMMSDVFRELRSWRDPAEAAGEPGDISRIGESFRTLVEPTRRAEVEAQRKVEILNNLAQQFEVALEKLATATASAGIPCQWTTENPTARLLAESLHGLLLEPGTGRCFQVGHAVDRHAYLGTPNSFYMWTGLAVVGVGHGNFVMAGGFAHGPYPGQGLPIGEFMWTSETFALGSALQDAELTDISGRMTESLGSALQILIDKLIEFDIQ
jgi:hypothetical protein